MHVEDALRYVEEMLAQRGKRLSDVQRAVFRGSWLGKSYKEIRRDCPGLKVDYIMKDVGPSLWNLLSEVFGEEVTKKNLQGPIERSHHLRQPARAGVTSGEPADQTEMQRPERSPSERLSSSPGLPTLEMEAEEDPSFWSNTHTRQDWDSAPDVSQFYGRDRDLEQLQQWVTIQGCRLVAVYGMGGVGKTDFSVRLAQQVRDQFDYVIWRSLTRWHSLNRPPLLDELVADLIQFLSDQKDTSSDLSRLLHYLSHHPCLIVLDGFESVLRSGVHDGSYQAGYELYGELLRRVGGSNHQSCLVLTSREKPREIARLEGEERPVRSRRLDGLGELGGQRIFSAKGEFSGSEADWITLIRRYTGNPLALNVVATRVWEVFGGEIAKFLEQIREDTLIFDEICEVLHHQLERLSELERKILYCLAIHHQPAEVAEILESLTQPLSHLQLQDGLQSLLRRSLIELNASRYSLDPLMMEYVLKSHQSGKT
ncbi:NB-ARC domain-containing protein [Leptothermofonsia sp. ETS-13]|uniref:NB-ARC domain-containing protein n=1 Tax=Leptothermofonsia sp. ETS-13 TaxID=3035696 RepID=UPI003BA3C5DE